MTKGQKLIKYFAITLAIFLIVSIGVGIISFVNDVISAFQPKLYDEKSTYICTETAEQEINSLEIKLKTSKLKIYPGESFSIETNNKNISYSFDKDKIIIKEKKYINFNNSITITIPKDKIFDSVYIDSGTGNIDADDLSTLYLELDGGVGDITFNNLSVTDEIKIENGVGNIELLDSQINNFEFDGGVGNFRFEGDLFGKSDFDTGVGDIYLEINSSLDDYTVEVDKGIGNITINDEKVNSNYRNNKESSKSILIDGGIGNITLKSRKNIK